MDKLTEEIAEDFNWKYKLHKNIKDGAEKTAKEKFLKKSLKFMEWSLENELEYVKNNIENNMKKLKKEISKIQRERHKRAKQTAKELMKSDLGKIAYVDLVKFEGKGKAIHTREQGKTYVVNSVDLMLNMIKIHKYLMKTNKWKLFKNYSETGEFNNEEI